MPELFHEDWPFILGHGSMYERLRRDPRMEPDPHIFHAALVYSEAGRDLMASVLREYLDIGQRHRLPMAACTPTWRASADRVARSGFAGRPVNRDGAAFMREVRDAYGPEAAPLVLSGVAGPKGDAYKPAEAPGRDEARRFHAPQIAELADSNLDFLEAKTLPALDEALGLADLFAETNQPYSLSFVLRPDGTLLDGTPMGEAIDRIDTTVSRPPSTYQVNCVHAAFFAQGYQAIQSAHPAQALRITGLEANTAALSPEDLDGQDEIIADTPEDFARDVWALYDSCGARYLGGCCGTGTPHIEALAAAATKGLAARTA